MTNSEGAPVWDGRAELLDQLTTYVRAAWESFEHPRQAEPIAPEDVVGHLSDGLPLTPDDPERTLADAVSVLESSISPSRPLYMAYIGSSGLEAGVLASTLTNLYDVNLATAAGTADALDAQAVRWMGEFVGFPVADGHFTSGGQTSNLTAILAARERAIPGARKNGIGGVRAAVYCSEEAHFSNVRAAEAAGLGSSSVRKIPLDAERRMRADALDARLSADRAEGIVPIVVIATSGTTLTGAVDPLDEIADVCSKHGVWLHVDGAYGLPAAATELAGFRFHGLDRADSVTVDLHKWMGLQKSCSLIMVRDRHVLLHTFGHDERYMLHPDDSVNPVDRTFEYSRPFRALKLWLAFRLYGAEQYRRWITQTLERVQQLAEAVRAHDAFELLHEPQLSTLCFRYTACDDPDAFNERLALAVQRDGRLFLAPARVDGKTCLRVTFVNYRTTAEDVSRVVPILEDIAATLRSV